MKVLSTIKVERKRYKNATRKARNKEAVQYAHGTHSKVEKREASDKMLHCAKVPAARKLTTP